MKGKLNRPVILIIVLVLLTTGIVGIASASKPARVVNPAGKSWSALEKVPRFLAEVERSGFKWQEGIFSFLDLIQNTCKNTIFSALGNNPWPNAYFSLQMPNPPDANYPPPYGQLWQMEQDQAIVIIGQTPPEVRYFSIQSWVQAGPVLGIPDPAHPSANRKLIGSAFGDTTNNLTIHTVGLDPFNRPIVYIVVANRTTEQRVRDIVRRAGYPVEIINVETISTIIAPLGIGPSGSFLVTAQRNAVPADPEGAWKDYIEASIVDDPNQPHTPYRAFRLTPQVAIPENPFPAPKLRVRGTGQTEMDLYPALKRLRQAILDKEAQRAPALPVKELGGRLWQDPMVNGQLELIDEPWANLQNGHYSYLGSRDTNYIQTYPYFKLRDTVDEYIIVYGVNHQKTGKATYANFSVYVEPTFGTGREIGLGSVADPKFAGSAEVYLGPDDPDADMLYAFKIARHCPAGDPYCLQVGPPSDMNGVPYNDNCTPQISLEMDPGAPGWKSDVFVVFRAYMEPATAVSPDVNELVWDRAIYFGPYFTP